MISGVEMPDDRRIYKRWTARYKLMRKPGDTFDVRHQWFRITRIFRARLEEVARNYESMGVQEPRGIC